MSSFAADDTLADASSQIQISGASAVETLKYCSYTTLHYLMIERNESVLNEWL